MTVKGTTGKNVLTEIVLRVTGKEHITAKVLPDTEMAFDLTSCLHVMHVSVAACFYR